MLLDLFELEQEVRMKTARNIEATRIIFEAFFISLIT